MYNLKQLCIVEEKENWEKWWVLQNLFNYFKYLCLFILNQQCYYSLTYKAFNSLYNLL